MSDFWRDVQSRDAFLMTTSETVANVSRPSHASHRPPACSFDGELTKSKAQVAWVGSQGTTTT